MKGHEHRRRTDLKSILVKMMICLLLPALRNRYLRHSNLKVHILGRYRLETLYLISHNRAVPPPFLFFFILQPKVSFEANLIDFDSNTLIGSCFKMILDGLFCQHSALINVKAICRSLVRAFTSSMCIPANCARTRPILFCYFIYTVIQIFDVVTSHVSPVNFVKQITTFGRINVFTIKWLLYFEKYCRP